MATRKTNLSGGQRELQARTVQGTEPWPRTPIGDPDTTGTVVATQHEALLLQPGFDPDGVPILHIQPHDLRTGTEGPPRTVVPQAPFEAGFCSVAVPTGSGNLICDDSQGVPFVLDVTTGSVTQLPFQGIGAPGRVLDVPQVP